MRKMLISTIMALLLQPMFKRVMPNWAKRKARRVSVAME